MKIKVLATGNSPDFYSFSGDTVTVFKDGQSESFDLSTILYGDKFEGIEVDTLDLNPQHILRNVYRDSSGVLHASICQQVGPGHWLESEEFDSNTYMKSAVHVVLNTNKPYSGKAWAKTSEGRRWVL